MKTDSLAIYYSSKIYFYVSCISTLYNNSSFKVIRFPWILQILPLYLRKLSVTFFYSPFFISRQSFYSWLRSLFGYYFKTFCAVWQPISRPFYFLSYTVLFKYGIGIHWWHLLGPNKFKHHFCSIIILSIVYIYNTFYNRW